MLSAMIRLEITEQQLADIAEAIDDPATTEKVKRKLLALRMHHEEAKAGFITKVLNVHQNSITNYLKEYRDGGLPATVEDRHYRPLSALAPYEECLKCQFSIRPVTDAKDAVSRIKSFSRSKSAKARHDVL